MPPAKAIAAGRTTVGLSGKQRNAPPDANGVEEVFVVCVCWIGIIPTA